MAQGNGREDREQGSLLPLRVGLAYADVTTWDNILATDWPEFIVILQRVVPDNELASRLLARAAESGRISWPSLKRRAFATDGVRS